MKTRIVQTGDFVREVEISQVTALEQTYHLAFSSLLLTAKDPQSIQRNFGLVLNRDEVQVLRDLLSEALKVDRVQDESDDVQTTTRIRLIESQQAKTQATLANINKKAIASRL